MCLKVVVVPSRVGSKKQKKKKAIRRVCVCIYGKKSATVVPSSAWDVLSSIERERVGQKKKFALLSPRSLSLSPYPHTFNYDFFERSSHSLSSSLSLICLSSPPHQPTQLAFLILFIRLQFACGSSCWHFLCRLWPSPSPFDPSHLSLLIHSLLTLLHSLLTFSLSHTFSLHCCHTMLLSA